jgi:spore coat-associated protein N
MTAAAAPVLRPQRNRRRFLGSLATVAVAGALAVGSGATFTADSSNPGNLYASGTLLQDNSQDGKFIFNAENLKPGDTLVGTVTITNSGTLPALMSLSQTAANNGFVVKPNLQLSISEVGGDEVWSGTFGTLPTVQLGEWAAGEARTYTFTSVLDSGAGNDEQGKRATADFRWDAVQTAAVTIQQP